MLCVKYEYQCQKVGQSRFFYEKVGESKDFFQIIPKNVGKSRAVGNVGDNTTTHTHTQTHPHTYTYTNHGIRRNISVFSTFQVDFLMYCMKNKFPLIFLKQ